MEDDIHVLKIPSWFYNPSGDSTTTVRDQAIALSNYGIDVGVIFAEIKGPRDFSVNNLRNNHFQIEVDGLEEINVERFKGWRVPTFQKKSLIRVNNFLRKLYYYRAFKRYSSKHGRPDILHAHDAMWGGLVAKYISEKENIPYILTQHRPDIHSKEEVVAGWSREHRLDKWQIKLIKKVFESAERVISVSDSLNRSLSSLTSNTRIKTIYNMVDKEIPSKKTANSEVVFLTLSRHIERKNLSGLIKAFNELSSERDCRLKIPSSGPEEENLKNLVNKMDNVQLNEDVIFLDWMSERDLMEEVRNSNYVVLPSYAECFPMSNLEAVSLGTPVITTPYGGSSEILDEGIGIKISSTEVDSIKIALEEGVMRQNEFDSNKISHYANQNFSPSKICNEIKSLYYDVLNDDRK